MRRGPSTLNCVIGVDKPAGMTSHDVVGRLRHVLGERRIGHAGTLDPAATGVLVIGIGQGTRLLGLLGADEKSYDALIRFGSETTTDDAEGDVVRTAEVPSELAQKAFARSLLSSFEGRLMQVPPAYSAVFVDGRRAYDIARSGGEVRLEPRPVTVRSARLIAIEPFEGSGAAPQGGALCWRCHFDVSKGTYIRSLARDIGRRAHSAAQLAGLRRTSSGRVTLADCLTLGALEREGRVSVEGRLLDPAHLLGAPIYALSDERATEAAAGRRIKAPEYVSEGERVCLIHKGGLVGVWRRVGSTLCCDVNFPQAIEGVRPR